MSERPLILKKLMTPADELESRLSLAEAVELTGQNEHAKEIYESFVKYYFEKNPQTTSELTSIARALVHLESSRTRTICIAKRSKPTPNILEAQLGAGELFTEKYNYGDAAQFLERCAASESKQRSCAP